MFVDHSRSLVDEIDALGPQPKKRAWPERDIQRACIKWLRVMFPGGLFAAVVNEQRGAGQTEAQRARYGQARKASGVVTGFFDMVGLIDGPTTLLIEYKDVGGIVSEAQQQIHAQARALGHIVMVVDGLESLRWGLRQNGLRTREAGDAPERPPQVRYAKPKRAMPADSLPF